MISSPLVSIVMCVYNGSGFLKDQLDSILRQSYSNLELICVDDSSHDNSLEILESYKQKDARVKVYKNAQNIGFNKNFERGISLCSGHFIAISDQDDIWLPEKIQELVDNLGDGILIYSSSELIDEHNNSLHQNLEKKRRHLHQPSYKAFLVANFITGHTCLFKRELIKSVLPFPDNVVYYDWWIGFAAAYVGKITYLPKILTRHRVHGTSVVQQEKGTATSRVEKNKKVFAQFHSFSEAAFVNAADRKFIKDYISIREAAPKSAFHFMKCFTFLFQKQQAFFPWHNKSYVSKLNLIRKNCN